jgi:UDP-N-acetylenolpyruvoylglucosamine reductase
VPPRRATARRVIERAGLFDVRVRDVWLPAAAPDLLVNLGNATARDVQLVLTAACDRISRETGLDLAPRVRWTGRAA